MEANDKETVNIQIHERLPRNGAAFRYFGLAVDVSAMP